MKKNQVYSLCVKPHRKHFRNWVEDSSKPLVCTCQTFAVLFPHFGHARMYIACFPEFTLTGFNIEPHSLQKSIDYFSVIFTLNPIVDSPDTLGVYHTLPC